MKGVYDRLNAPTQGASTCNSQRRLSLPHLSVCKSPPTTRFPDIDHFRLTSQSILIHSPPQIPRLPHQLLILVFLHLQFPLPFHANHPPYLSFPSTQSVFPCLMSNLHPFEEGLSSRKWGNIEDLVLVLIILFRRRRGRCCVGGKRRNGFAHRRNLGLIDSLAIWIDLFGDGKGCGETTFFHSLTALWRGWFGLIERDWGRRWDKGTEFLGQFMNV